MANSYSANDLLDFLDHAGDRGLMPAATAQALAVASRNVLGVLSEEERQDLSQQDLDSVIRRFNNKRARDFNPSSLKEYARRLHRAIGFFLKWREDPANFTVRTRSTPTSRKKDRGKELSGSSSDTLQDEADEIPSRSGTYQSSIPVRPGIVVTLANVPYDLSKTEAERLANFVRMLAVDSS